MGAVGEAVACALAGGRTPHGTVAVAAEPGGATEEAAAADGVALVLGALPSGARIAIDAQGRWVLAADGGAPATFGPGAEGRFVEVLEQGRRDFDDLLERGAREAGLPVDEVLAGFPAVELLRSVLSMSSGYTARLALRWILPSERAELLPVITPLVKNGDMPQDVRDLARHLAR